MICRLAGRLSRGRPVLVGLPKQEPRFHGDVVLASTERQTPLRRKDPEMAAIKDIDTILSSQDLPEELMRCGSSSHQGDEPEVASMLSGMIAARRQDDVICPLMLRRHLIVPAHHGSIAQSAWRVD
jgi:hypothetical protein